MTNTLAIALIVAILVFEGGCARHENPVAISDVTQQQELVLRRPNSTGHVTSLHIHAIGRIDGTSTLSLVLDGKPYGDFKLNGSVDSDWEGHWYSDSATLRYEPGTVKSGELRIEYEFITA